MVEKRATALLQEEHRLIQRAVAAMVMLADRLETGREVRPEILRDVVELMRTLVSDGHEAKEERHLFPVLQSRGVSLHSVPTRMLVEEHQRGAALVAKLEEAAAAHVEGTDLSRGPLVESLRGLAALYPLHIWQEDLLLFHMADRVLTSEDDLELIDAYRAVDEAIGGDVRRRLEDLVLRIEKESW